MSNMNEGAKKDKTLTMAEREPSACTRRKERNTLPKSRFWEGMNERDETDEVTHNPVGRGLTEGFKMMSNDYDGYDIDGGEE